MSNHTRFKAACLALLAAPALVFAQADMPPVNDLPNPYITQSGYFKMPAGREWGSSSTVDVHPDGESIWIAERCGGNINACINSPDTNMVMLFDKDGNMVRSFGAGYITWPHGIEVDHDGNVWIADARGTNQIEGYDGEPYGHQVHKFSPTGVHLMSIGVKGGGSNGECCYTPNDVLVAPDGSIFIGEGHSSAEGTPNAMYKYDAEGNLIKKWGEWGMEPGNFRQPHALHGFSGATVCL